MKNAEEDKEKFAWLKKAYGYHLLERYHDAIFACNQALQIDKTFARAHFGRALAFSKLNQIDAALSALKQTVRYNRNHIRACILAGNIYYEKRQYRRAIRAYNLALRIDPIDKDALDGKEKATICQKEQDEQRQESVRQLAILTSQILEHVAIGNKYYDEENYDKALEAYTDALQFAPDNHDVLRRKAKTYMKLERYEEAKKIYNILQPVQVMGKMVPYSW